MKFWVVIKLVITVWVFFWSVFHDDYVWIFPCVSLGELVQQSSATFVLSLVVSERHPLTYRDTGTMLFVCLFVMCVTGVFVCLTTVVLTKRLHRFKRNLAYRFLGKNLDLLVVRWYSKSFNQLQNNHFIINEQKMVSYPVSVFLRLYLN